MNVHGQLWKVLRTISLTPAHGTVMGGRRTIGIREAGDAVDASSLSKMP
jgi:hypothetical protein